MLNSRETEKLLARMRRQFAQAEAEEFDLRKEAREDIRFTAGKQWDPAIAAARDRAGRPALVFNNLPTFVHQVANEARQNKPQVKFSPGEDGDKDTAEVCEGLARQIQQASRADIAYETAVHYATCGSFGHFRLLTEYCDKPGAPSLHQDIKFAPIVDPFSVYGCLLPRLRGQKPRTAFVVETITRDEYESLYPDSELAGKGFEWGTQLAGDDWIGDDVIRIAEYWYTDTKKRNFQLRTDGNKGYADELGELPEGVEVQTERISYENTIKFVKTNGVEILEETEWVGAGIPIYTVLGWQLVVDGKFECYGLVRFLRDPQKLLNVYKSGIAEQIGLTNRVPYLGYKGQFKDAKWQTANVTNYPYLEVEPVIVNGVMAPLPQRQQFEAPIQALSLAAAQEIDDLKRIAGIHDASMGAESNETSGIAIQRRQAQSGLINFHILDNLKRAQDECGEELGYTIPRVYDAERTIRILGEDMKPKIVKVNAPWQDPETGKPTNFMLSSGSYDVVTINAPTNQTARQEAAENTGRVIQAAPDLMGVIGDIYLRNLDGPGSDESADRVKKWIDMRNPGLIEDPNQQQQIPPQVQAKFQALVQQHDQLMQEVQILTQEREAKTAELASRERIAMEHEITTRTVALAQIHQKDGIALLEAELAQVNQRLDKMHQAQMQQTAGDQAHAAAAQQQAQQQQAEPDQDEQQQPAIAA